MDVPLEDFCHLPQQLGCSLHRAGDTLTLTSEQPGCAMHFEVEGLQARLAAVEVSNDPQGRFFRDVVGLVLQLYSGDLEAQLTWSPRGAMAERLLVRGGETTHPLLVHGHESPGGQSPDETPPPPADDSLPRAEAFLAEAHLAWGQYLQLRTELKKQVRSLT